MESEVVVAAPASRLRHDVRRYYGYSYRGAPKRRPEPFVAAAVLIVGLGPELRVHDGRGRTARVHSLVAGLDDVRVETEHDGELRGVQVDLSPLAVRRLTGVSMHELARRVVPLEDVLGRAALRLEERLVDARDWAQRFRLVDAFIARRLAQAPLPPADVARAWSLLESSHGRIRVDALARTLGCSRRHLTARFRDHVGLPPKLVARMLRFERAADLLAHGRPLAEIAFVSGYYDQPHLDRDFRDFARTTPTAYLAQFPFVQDTPPVAS